MTEKLAFVSNIKCCNPNHRRDAEGSLGRQVLDYYTMEVARTGDNLNMYCPWCGYMTEVSLTELDNHRLTFVSFSGDKHTFEL